MQQIAEAKESSQGQGPNYFLSIEGKDYPWDEDTITTAQIAQLGGWDVSQGVIEVDKDNNERTLAPNEVVEAQAWDGIRQEAQVEARLSARPVG